MTPTAPTSVETPSGKDEAYENFPVSPLVLPRRTRPHVTRFYAFARAIDDIADNPALSPEEKIRRLDGFAAAISGENADDPDYATGQAFAESLRQTEVTAQHGLDLIDAFKQDAVQNRYETWSDLMHYCDRSAAPVGRYLIDLHGGSKRGYESSDALCNALQVINHLQDCKDDYLDMDRIYLPQVWMRADGASDEDLGRAQCKSGLRAVLDQCLDDTERLMGVARTLPKDVKSLGLSMMSAAIIDIAETLIERLRDKDPLAGKVKLSKPGYLWCCLRGPLKSAMMI